MIIFKLSVIIESLILKKLRISNINLGIIIILLANEYGHHA